LSENFDILKLSTIQPVKTAVYYFLLCFYFIELSFNTAPTTVGSLNTDKVVLCAVHVSLTALNL